MGKPSAPTPPDPYQTAAAQTGTNVSTGVANAFLNNTNQVTPQGSLNYDVSGTYAWTDPSTGQSYNIPRFTATQSLNPTQSATNDQNAAAQFNLANIANTQSGRISGVLGSPFTPLSGAPAGGDASQLAGMPGAGSLARPSSGVTFGIGDVGNIQNSFGGGGPITKTYGPDDDFSTDRQNVQDALMARINPQLDVENDRIRQQLADQGIRYGSQAYTSAMDVYNRQANDARFGAISQAGTEQQRMMDMAAQKAGFQNAAQQQEYSQSQGMAQFANDAQNQRYTQALGEGAFYNQAVGQQNNQNLSDANYNNASNAQNFAQAQSVFNASNSQRNQYLQEQYAQRNQPMNEISALLQGSAVQSPNWLNTPQSQIATTDIGGLINQNFAQQQQNYQTQNQNYQQLMGGILGLGAGAMKLSDEREKKDIDKVGTVFAYDENAERQKLPIYEYQYKDDPASARHIGPMAQDVRRLDPGAVTNVRTPAGKTRMAIDTRKVMGNILRAA